MSDWSRDGIWFTRRHEEGPDHEWAGLLRLLAAFAANPVPVSGIVVGRIRGLGVIRGSETRGC